MGKKRTRSNWPERSRMLKNTGLTVEKILSVRYDKEVIDWMRMSVKKNREKKKEARGWTELVRL